MPRRSPSEGEPWWVHQSPATCAGLAGLPAVRDVGLDGLVLVEVGHRPVGPGRVLPPLEQMIVSE